MHRRTDGSHGTSVGTEGTQGGRMYRNKNKNVLKAVQNEAHKVPYTRSHRMYIRRHTMYRRRHKRCTRRQNSAPGGTHLQREAQTVHKEAQVHKAAQKYTRRQT